MSLKEPQQLFSMMLKKKIRQAKITEAAYYISEKRGFITGYEMDDWLKAEKEIINK